MSDRCVSSEPRKDLRYASRSALRHSIRCHNRGATNATHNLGGLHADVHHATMCGQWVTPEQLDNRIWECLLGKHRTDEPIQPLKL